MNIAQPAQRRFLVQQFSGKGNGFAEQFLRGHVIHRTQGERFPGGHRLARHHHRQRRLHTDQSRQTLGAAGARQQPELDFRKTDPGIGTGHAVMTAECDLETAAQRGAVNGRDDRLGAGFQGRHHVRQIRRRGRPAEFAYVRAGDEGAAGAFEHDGVGGGIVNRLLQGQHDAFAHLLGQRIDRR